MCSVITNTRILLKPYVQTNGKTYEDLCIKGTDGVTCAQNSRTVTRFWDDDFDTYEVRM